MKQFCVAFILGILFGLGLVISEMINPAKVLGFLNLFGEWDPSLALVMGGALVVVTLGYRFVWQRKQPILTRGFNIPAKQTIDRPLVYGAILFGVGWGLVGLCPGPAIAALSVGGLKAFVFVIAMVFGMLVYDVRNPKQMSEPSRVN